METLGVLNQQFQSSTERKCIKSRSNIKSASILVIILLSWITLMTSCGVFFHGPYYERHGQNRERTERGRGHDHDDHHDHDNHQEGR